MNKEKLLLKNTAIVTFGKICTQLITFLLLPVYTAVLTNEEYGIVDLLNTLVSLFIPIVTLQIEQGVFRFLIDCRDNEKEQKKIISTTIIFVFKQLAIYLIIFALACRFINNPYKFFLLSNLIATVFSSILLQTCRGLGDNSRYTIGSFISGFFTVVLNVFFIVALKLGAYGMLIATFIGNLICVIYVIFSKKIFKLISNKCYNKEKLKEILKYSIPLVPNIISWWVVNASDRSIVTYFLGIGENGIYATSNKFAGVFTTLYSVFNLTWTESASINIESEDKNEFFSNILDIVIRIFGSLVIGVIAVLPFVFSILINEKFNSSYYQIPILLLASLFNILVSFVGSIYVAKKKTTEIAKTSIFAAIINILTNIVFIKKIGLYAASISTLVAYMSMCIYRFIDSRKYVILNIKRGLFLSIVIMLVLSITGYYINNAYLSIVILTTVLFYAIYINRKSGKFVIKEISKKFK